MKFKDLNKVASLVFSESLSDDFFEYDSEPSAPIIGDGNDEIQLFLNGVEIDFNKFCTFLEASFDKNVEKRAKEIALQTQLSKLFIYEELEKRLWRVLEELRYAQDNITNAQTFLQKDEQ